MRVDAAVGRARAQRGRPPRAFGQALADATAAAARARAPRQPGKEEVETEARRHGVHGAVDRPRRRRVVGDQRGGERDVLGVALARLVLDELLLLVEEAAADGTEEAAAFESSLGLPVLRHANKKPDCLAEVLAYFDGAGDGDGGACQPHELCVSAETQSAGCYSSCG